MAETATKTRTEKWYGGDKAAASADAGADTAAAAGDGAADAGGDGGAAEEAAEMTPAERHKTERGDMFKRHDKAFSDIRKLQLSEMEAMFDRHSKELETGTAPDGAAAEAAGADASGNQAAAAE